MNYLRSAVGGVSKGWNSINPATLSGAIDTIVVEREDGSLLINGMMPAQDAFERLGLRTPPEEGDYHTVAGFVLHELGHLPEVGEHFDHEGWRIEVIDLDGRRIDKVLATLPKRKRKRSQ